MKFNGLKKLGVICVSAVMLLAGCSSNAEESQGSEKSGKEDLVIGVTQVVEHQALDAAREGFVEGLKESGFDNNIKFINKNAQGDMATAQIIAQGFADDKVDMIYAIATPTAQAAFNVTKEIPILISAVTDPVSAGLVDSIENPGGNVSGTSDAAPIDLQFNLLQQLNIETETIGFIYNTSEKNSEVQLELVKQEAKKRGLKVEALGITSITEIEQGLDVLLDKIDVLYTPTDNMVASAIHLVANKAINKKVPILAGEPQHVEGGALITCGVDYFMLGKQTGLMAAKVLNGEDISKLPIERAENPKVTINIKTAEKLGIPIDNELSNSSILVGVE